MLITPQTKFERFFNDEKFTLDDADSDKARLIQKKLNLKAQGFKVRIIPFSLGYLLYVND